MTVYATLNAAHPFSMLSFVVTTVMYFVTYDIMDQLSDTNFRDFREKYSKEMRHM